MNHYEVVWALECHPLRTCTKITQNSRSKLISSRKLQTWDFLWIFCISLTIRCCWQKLHAVLIMCCDVGDCRIIPVAPRRRHFYSSLKFFISIWYVGLLSTYSEAISMFQQYLGPSEGYSTTRRTQVLPGTLLLPDNIWWLYDISFHHFWLLIYPYDFDKDIMLILIYRLSKDCIFAHEASRKYLVNYNQSYNSSSIFKPAVIQGLLIIIKFRLLTRVSIQAS